MKKMFISLLLLTVLVLTNPSGSLHKTSDIPSSCPKNLITIDFKSRLNLAEKDLQNSRAGILKEVDVSEQDFHDFIKKNFNFYKDCFAQQITKYKTENKFCKLAKFSEEISAELQQNPKIEIFTIDNLFGKYGSPGITIGQTIFIDSKFVDNVGIIMHEICHAINGDQITICVLDSFIEQHNKNTKNSKFNRLANLRSKFYQRVEKRADLWSAAHGKDCAQQLADFFKSLGCASNKCHPDLAERIGYLS
jgi:hypothetical protein